MGKVIMSGIVPQLEYEAPVKGILASELAVGSTVKLMENGSAVEYLVVHKGRPSTLYDASCDGTWLLRKSLHSSRAYNTTATSGYGNFNNCSLKAWLNGDFFNTLGAIEQSAIKQVIIPYCPGNTAAVASGANGISLKVFLLGGYELGMTNSEDSRLPADGAKLDYFGSGAVSSSVIAKRIAYLNNTATAWWLRSARTNQDKYVTQVDANGGISGGSLITATNGVRPALILPSTALFDEETLILKGVI